MSVDFDLIRVIHSLLKQQSILRDRLDSGPRRLQMIKQNEAKFLAGWEDSKAEQRRIHQAVEEKQLQLDEREARLAQMKVRLNTCDSEKEFQILKERIAADLQANSVLQDEIFELLERLDAQKLQTQTAKVNHEQAQVDSDQLIQQLKTEHEQLQTDFNRVGQQLADAEKKLPGDILQQYRHAIRGLGEDVFGETDGKNCGNCHQSLTIQMSADLKMNRVVYCQGCGCLLYLALKTSVGRD